MMTVWHKIKAYVASVVAFIACPCHLPLTLPLLVSLTAGTAFSAWLAAPRHHAGRHWQRGCGGRALAARSYLP